MYISQTVTGGTAAQPYKAAEIVLETTTVNECGLSEPKVEELGLVHKTGMLKTMYRIT